MSTRTSLRPQSVITAASMAASITSDPTILQSLTRVSYQAVWSGSTAVGTLAIQVSNDYSLTPTGDVSNSGTWTVVPVEYNGATVASVPVSGSSGTAMLDGSTAAYAIRLIYTKSSGAGSLSATVCGKVS